MDRELLYSFITYLANKKLFKRRRVTLEDAVDMIKDFHASEFNPYRIDLSVTDNDAQKPVNTSDKVDTNEH